MKVPVRWLKDYVNVDIPAKELGDKLTLSGSKVEEVITTGDEINSVVTGKIIKIEKHPDADKLFVCSVDIGKEEPIQIVTAATNMKEQDIVPVALHGSTIHGGVKIKKGKLRGIMSNGMFCSEEELGIAGDKPVYGLMILPGSTPIGSDIKSVLDLDSSVIDFEITSNRPDCLSVMGIARETAAILNGKYRAPDMSYRECRDEDIKDKLKVEVEDELCRRYIAKIIRNVKIAQSPGWMQKRLLESGVRPINNIVDITNFVMLELGQPMHAYDLRNVGSRTIVVRRAGDGEKFTTLDGEERELDRNVLTIRDGERAIGLAGIMGGLNSEIKDDTRDIVFECANFDGTNIRISAQKLSLRTEASSRFEKDLDPNLAEIAMNRACHLVEKLGAGEIIEGSIDIYNKKIEPHYLEVDSCWINKFLGIDISAEQMAQYLDRLELKAEINSSMLKIHVPTFRSDINIKEDVAEEVARIYGYDKIPSTIIDSVNTRGGKSEKQKLDDKIIDILIASGLNQSISYSFFSRKSFDKICLDEDSQLRKVVTIRNPLGEDYSVMRTTTIPPMMEALGRNYSRNNKSARLFEIGRIYIPKDDMNKLPDEKNMVTAGMYGNVDYFDLKGVVENILSSFQIKDFSLKRESSNPTFHPGRTANLYIKNKFIGVFGEVHPNVVENYGIEDRCYIFELNLDLIYRYSNSDKKYRPLPKFPAVSRDIAVLVDKDVLVEDVENIIRHQGGKMVENIKLFDVYTGKQIERGKKSIAYSISYRLENRTLTDSEVNKVHDRILKNLENKLGAKLR
ncbi:MAG: phenylalanine--tRNA ligase subunit beta [Clostridium sp.]|jgi:phenylalanyl-tRNA synthetase beta chain|uniref:phenylalanine--tRNA ligase subunit beta n=1 Tax=Clostridium sp. TaxID=1506 RepID=UPI0025C5F5A2|nr:phenylalanine--tRNA ligase subunit beta [Clostridium sp.]MCH3962837.1 phenylalanine--tRNA ligase subunit beta [Clostridium sp.]MCI1715748.1 phenylalanine--tRNA ligase subunit beta [Clostridium sp.]MCI1800047.1 phenylalanine--tRNA ligase subunit beta [Clostridium sp.]MCI1813961.1 phenylalanine--tRNA ligase subunit beta [Clostridium sp.]MCI1870859.1 phenylalanine--tRNA ligase subunit beta [Clostridium sp.]